MPVHTVEQGECISSIADQYGLFWQTIWNHADNSQLKQLRKDPNALAPGDQVHVPDRQVKEEPGATEARHRFRKKGTPAKLKVRLLNEGQPRANLPFHLLIDGVWKDGTTDGDGYVMASIPPGAQSGKLVIGSRDSTEVYEFNLGTVDPIETEDGVRGRLHNLGYSVAEGLEAAVCSFQTKEGLTVTGQVDDATRAKLKDRFGQ